MSPPPRVIVPDRLLEPGSCHPLEASLRHRLTDVLRLRRGDPVVVVDREGRAFRARIEGGRGDWTLRVIGPEPSDRMVQDVLRVRLLMGLLKADRTEWAVQKTTELGVCEVRVVVCERSVPRPAGAIRRLARMRRVAAEAARQCGRATIPDVSLHDGLVSALADLPRGGRRFVLDEAPATRPLTLALAGAGRDDVVLAVGPEGSFSPWERELLTAAGFEPAGLGPRVLRAETAAVVAVTVVQTVVGDLSGRDGEGGREAGAGQGEEMGNGT